MTGTNRRRSLLHSIKGIFRANKTTNAHKLYPIAYYKRYYLSKPMSDGVEFLAKTQRKSKIWITNELMELGIKTYLSPAAMPKKTSLRLNTRFSF
jgi:hypothetical protein